MLLEPDYWVKFHGEFGCGYDLLRVWQVGLSLGVELGLYVD